MAKAQDRLLEFQTAVLFCFVFILNKFTEGYFSSKTGALYAVLAYSAWGLFPIYWKFLTQVPAIEVVCHRIIWSMVLLMGLLWRQNRIAEFRQLWRSPKSILALLLTTTLIAGNWGIYIYGVNSGHIVEASLGYYINPLVTVLLGSLILKERLNLGKKIAVLLAAIAVLNFVWQFGQVPWIAIALAFTFALYGLFRKLITVTPMVGLAVETLLATPIALFWIAYLGATGVGSFATAWQISALLIGCGVVTALPLLWFNTAAKRLQLSTLGFFQYLSPSLALLIGVVLYREPFTAIHAVTFLLIWAAIAVYSIASVQTGRSVW
ncbi:EamA family transporter RarD [Cyanobacteria bacterium FACHB-63]|nr:EamA family transporter RarD [Cyanobacteria bacterium FACHB-63]